METELILDDEPTFFAPVNTDAIDTLLAQYEAEKQHILRLAGFMAEGMSGVVRYFSEGYRKFHGYDSAFHTPVFDTKYALPQLDAEFWSRAMQATDVMEYMPQKRRDEWHEQLSHPWGKKRRAYNYDKGEYEETWTIEPLPQFTEESVRPTLTSLLLSREKFFGERVDGVFRALSRDHVTNVPEGFSKRMILNYVINEWGSVESSKAGYINDLRCVIAKFMGLEPPDRNNTYNALYSIKSTTGVWVPMDGNTLRIKVFKKGTVHLEVHPDIAWRLNSVLASMYPAAIPSQFRSKPEKRQKEYGVIQKMLPTAVRSAIGNGRWHDAKGGNPPRFCFSSTSHETNKAAVKAAISVLEGIGGVYNGASVTFDYDASGVIGEIRRMGCVPEHKSHQFYPTPTELAERVVYMAEVGDQHTCLEPSAGTGAIAHLLPKERTTCVELSHIHCEVLRAKGYEVFQEDFLSWGSSAMQFDRIVMNPPFSEGRAIAHAKLAYRLLAPQGIMVAILPSSLRDKLDQIAMHYECSETITGAFDGTGVSVIIAKFVKH